MALWWKQTSWHPRGPEAITFESIFEAPRELVFKTVIDPELVSQWWGPSELTTTVEKMETKPGGIWRYVQRDKDGNVYSFKGVYHEVAPPERLVYTMEFEGMPGHVTLESVTFEELDGKTRMVDSIIFQAVEDRDGALATGMEEGAVESAERFAQLLEKLKK